jgi:hypothetical protein
MIRWCIRAQVILSMQTDCELKGPARLYDRGLVERMTQEALTLVGIDHVFSFPLRYFGVHARLLSD